MSKQLILSQKETKAFIKLPLIMVTERFKLFGSLLLTILAYHSITQMTTQMR